MSFKRNMSSLSSNKAQKFEIFEDRLFEDKSHSHIDVLDNPKLEMIRDISMIMMIMMLILMMMTRTSGP